jgi:hypothetical protein
MESFLILARTVVPNAYSLAVGSASLLFLVLFAVILIVSGLRAAAAPPVSYPSRFWWWLNFVYPGWLDWLGFRQILLGFAWALSGAAVIWTLAVLIILLAVGKPHVP